MVGLLRNSPTVRVSLTSVVEVLSQTLDHIGQITGREPHGCVRYGLMFIVFFDLYHEAPTKPDGTTKHLASVPFYRYESNAWLVFDSTKEATHVVDVIEDHAHFLGDAIH